MKFLGARLESVVSLVVALVVLSVVAVGSVSQFRRFLSALDWFDHSQDVVQTLLDLQLDIVKIETGQRGFLLTHKSSYLAPYSEGRRSLGPRVIQLEGLFARDADQRDALTALCPLLNAKLNEMDQTIHLDSAGQSKNSLRLVRSNRGKLLMDDIHDRVEEMVSLERQRLAQHTQTLHRRISKTIEFFIAGFLSSILFLLWAFRLLSNEIRAHTAAEASARASERQFRESEALLRRLLNNARDYALYLLDPEGRILTWTEAAERLHGFPSHEVLGKRHDLVFSKEDLAEGKAQKILADAVNAGSYEERTTRVRKDGSTFAADVSLTPIYESAGTLRGFTQITRDVTERLQSETALQRAQAQVSQLQKMDAIGRLAGGIAHDFNNLLTGILGYGEDLLAELPKESEAWSDVNEIVKAGLRAASLTRQLLAFSRKQVASPRVISVNDVVSELDKMLRRVVPENIHFILHLAENLGHVKADPTQFEQILMNLVVNARDAMPQGGKITIETSNVDLDDAYAHEREELVPGPYVLLAVSDVGQGMTKDIQTQIFEPFFTTKPYGQGTGLGLSTVYGIVKQNGGHIFVYSNPGLGTTFKIYLPRTADAADVSKPVVPAASLARGHETILVVEDEDLVRSLATRTLQSAGFKVLEASAGVDAIRLSSSQPVDTIQLLLSDVVMPGMNGPVVADSILKRHPNAKVLYMSGYTQNIIVHGGILKPGILLLEKPFNTSELIAKVRSVLDSVV